MPDASPSVTPRPLLYDVVRGFPGAVWFALAPVGLARVAPGDLTEARFLQDLRAAFPAARPERAPEAPDVLRAARQITAYLEGSRRRFTLEVDLSGAPPFRRRILEAAAGIPFGEVITYGALAARAGRAGAARAVGGALGANPVPLVIPCHRVVAASRRIGGFSVPGKRGGVDLKRRLLVHEGVEAIGP